MRRPLVALLGLTSLALVGLAGAPPLSAAPSTSADAAPPPTEACSRTRFETDLVREACAKGGKAEAKVVMKAFVAEVKRELGQTEVSCKTCHSSLGPDYPVNADGLAKLEAWQKALAARRTE